LSRINLTSGNADHRDPSTPHCIGLNFYGDKLIGHFCFEGRKPGEYSYLKNETPLQPKLYFATIRSEKPGPDW